MDENLPNRSKNVKISIIEYSADSCFVKDNATIEDCIHYIQTLPNTWINIVGTQNAEIIEKIGNFYGLHPLVIEDIFSATQRSKFEDYKSEIFMVMRMLSFKNENETIYDQQVSFILSKNTLISFVERENGNFDSIRNKLIQGNKRLRESGPDYLCYSLMDIIVDQYFYILEKVDDRLSKLEDSLVKNPSNKVMRDIQKQKRQIVLLRKSVWPLREAISSFQRLDTPLITGTTRLFMRDVYDHTIQAIDTIESFRDIISGMLDVYLSNTSQRLNETMKVLTVVATIFAPLTFISSLYGMNFKYMPELDWKYGYPFTLGVMAVSALIMLFIFRKKRWI